MEPEKMFEFQTYDEFTMKLSSTDVENLPEDVCRLCISEIENYSSGIPLDVITVEGFKASLMQLIECMYDRKRHDALKIKLAKVITEAVNQTLPGEVELEWLDNNPVSECVDKIMESWHLIFYPEQHKEPESNFI